MPLAILEKEDVAFRATVWKCQPAILMMEKRMRSEIEAEEKEA